jgi:putative oxidoreductase
MSDSVSMVLGLLFDGFDLEGLLLLINRVVVGVFFAISGFHKLFLRSRHKALVQTLKDDGIPAIGVFQWLVPLVEFCAGIALVLGFLAPLAALGILILMTVAILADGTKRVREFKPVDKADALDDVLYLSETTYWFMSLFVILGGPGWFSLHNVLLP